ncbi:MAG: Smr/MutS family protein [Pseudomonadota bacterium]
MSASGKGRRLRGLSEEDRALWARVAATATPLSGSASTAALGSARSEATGGPARRLPDDDPTFARHMPDAGPTGVPTSARRQPDAGQTKARRKPDESPTRFGAGTETRTLRPSGPPSQPVITTRAARSPLDSLNPAAGLDKRTANKLKRGKRNPEARLDLHGMTAAAAHSTLTRFLHRARAEGKRCVLVITGKGGRRPVEDAPYMPERIGVLRYAVPEWLTTAPLAPLVVGVYPAHQSHGGPGALYVYLKKLR